MMTRATARQREIVAAGADERVRLLAEVLPHMASVKALCAEDAVEERIMAVRRREQRSLRRAGVVIGLTHSLEVRGKGCATGPGRPRPKPHVSLCRAAAGNAAP